MCTYDRSINYFEKQVSSPCESFEGCIWFLQDDPRQRCRHIVEHEIPYSLQIHQHGHVTIDCTKISVDEEKLTQVKTVEFQNPLNQRDNF